MNVHLADNLALGKTARQVSTYILAAHSAVDGDVTTPSCTMAERTNPWWSVDLGKYYHISRVTVTFPSINKTYIRNYILYTLFINPFYRSVAMAFFKRILQLGGALGCHAGQPMVLDQRWVAVGSGPGQPT